VKRQSTRSVIALHVELQFSRVKLGFDQLSMRSFIHSAQAIAPIFFLEDRNSDGVRWRTRDFTWAIAQKALFMSAIASIFFLEDKRVIALSRV
jgi:hypothetical protein